MTGFLTDTDTSRVGGKSHPYPEKVLIVSGRLYDDVFGSGWRPAIAQVDILVSLMAYSNGCLILEVSFPNRVDESSGS